MSQYSRYTPEQRQHHINKVRQNYWKKLGYDTIPDEETIKSLKIDHKLRRLKLERLPGETDSQALERLEQTRKQRVKQYTKVKNKRKKDIKLTSRFNKPQKTGNTATVNRYLSSGYVIKGNHLYRASPDGNGGTYLLMYQRHFKKTGR